MMTPIGVIHSPYATKEAAPIQGAFCPEGKGTVGNLKGFDK